MCLLFLVHQQHLKVLNPQQRCPPLHVILVFFQPSTSRSTGTQPSTSQNPGSVLTTQKDFFGHQLQDTDETLVKLRQTPADEKMFKTMMKECLSAIVVVLERQYKRYFSVDVTEQLRKETESARSHNIDAEEVMGMFSAAKDHAPNATLCYLSSRIRAQKNRVTNYLDSLERDKRDKLIKMSISLGRNTQAEEKEAVLNSTGNCKTDRPQTHKKGTDTKE